MPMNISPWQHIEGSDEHHLTIHAVDFTDGYKSVAVRHYIALDEHKRLMREKETTLVNIVSAAVERGVYKGVASATEKHIETLEETHKAKLGIEAQIADLQRQLKELDTTEERIKQRQTALEEQERLHKEKAQLRAAEKAEQDRLKAERATTRNRAGYVYILKQINGEHYKIGRTSNPDNRLATFNVKLPFPVEYEHLIQTDDMYALESELHQRYASKRVNGSEFFKLTPQDIQELKGITR
jgi:hypothetical protein